MSRTKKSRKPGTGSLGAVKDDKKKLIPAAPRRLKKKNGKEAGNRQKEATATTNGAQSVDQKKDPRIGNKTPIVLGNATSSSKPLQAKVQQIKTASVKTTKQKLDNSPIAAIRAVEVTTEESLSEQLLTIEQDIKLLEIIEKQDSDEVLTAEEVNYYNELMEQHEKISAKLGLADDDEVITNTRVDSEDELWDKFDNSSLSEFE